MKLYRLTADTGQLRNTVHFLAPSDEEAMITAAFKVMDAASKSRVWAQGEITLRGEDSTVISVMPRKNGDQS